MIWRTGVFVFVLVAAAACGGGGGGGGDATSPVIDVPPGGGGNLVDEAIKTCVWSTGCLNPEDSGGGGAPNTNVSSCIATFMTQRARPVTSPPTAPWAAYRACTATATTCASFISCLESASAICGAAGAWQKGVECPDGTRSCTGSCLGTCTGGAVSCSSDKARLIACNGSEATAACDMGAPGGECVEFGGGANCLPGTVGTCSTQGFTCDGSVQVICLGGIENRFDCALAGQTCGGSQGQGCQDATACTYMHTDACTGNTLSACVSGSLHDIDCAALGGTCGTLTSGRAGCVFP